MSWIATSIAAAATIGGAIDANQKKQRNKGYIADAYTSSKQRLALQQTAGRQASAEALGARGLTSGGDVNTSPIATAMVGGEMTATGATPHTLGAQQASDNAVQMGLETKDLEQQRGQAEAENKAQYTSSLIGGALNGVNMAVGLHGAGQEIGAIKEPSPIKAAMTGIDSPSNWFGGVHGINPLTAPGSTWNNGAAGVTNAHGEANADFHIG